MPTPYGSLGGVAFSADELRVVRDALAPAPQSGLRYEPPAPPTGRGPAPRPGGLGSPGRHRGRTTLARGCLELSAAPDEAIDEAHRTRGFLLADLARYRAAPGALCALPAAPGDEEGGRLLPRRCEPSARCTVPRGQDPRRPVLRVLPGGRGDAGEPEREPAAEPAPERAPARQPGARPQTQPQPRPVPTPAEVFPPRRRPSPPPEDAPNEDLLPPVARSA